MDNKNIDSLTDLEKENLKKRISKSVRSIKARKLIRYSYGAAASITILVVAASIYFMQPKEVSITDYVNSATGEDVKTLENVVLILNETDNVQIDEKSVSINYSKTGEKVNIGSKKAINQKTIKNKKVVYNTLLVPYGRRSKIKLSDGSMVWLNSGSKLVYPSVFNGEKREVYLEGEAIFDVTHDSSHPFKVISKDQEISVLGTVFNVSNYKEDNMVNTVLKSGSVRIDYTKDSSNKTIKLSPGNMAAYSKEGNTMKMKKVDVYNYFSWRDGVLIFRNNNLKYIMSKLSRYYNVKINITDIDLEKETFSGYLDLKNDVENVLSTIKETTNFNYEIVKN